MSLAEAFQQDIQAAVAAMSSADRRTFPRIKYFRFIPIVSSGDPVGLGIVEENARETPPNLSLIHI